MPVCVYVTVVDGVMQASFFVDATRVHVYMHNVVCTYVLQMIVYNCSLNLQ